MHLKEFHVNVRGFALDGQAIGSILREDRVKRDQALTKSVATTRVFPRKSFTTLTLQKAVLFDLNASSCSNSPVIAFQSEMCPGLLRIIRVSALFCRSLTHISAATYGSIVICNSRYIRLSITNGSNDGTRERKIAV